ncbi:MAG: molybdate ABC transporter substrate-binding protein, partial [Hydrogenophaga sp.]
QISTGASGAIAGQIKNGAPFDVFLSADQERPEWLEKEGLVQAGSRFTYAMGRLVLWSNKVGRADPQGAVLRADDLGRVAFANPKTAPYGAAAVQAIEKMGLSASLAPKLVQGESIGKTLNFVSTGNADVGFVAMSQVLEGGKLKGGSLWVIPQALYSPIRQDAVLLKRGADNPAAKALMQMLQSPATQALIRSYGYGM